MIAPADPVLDTHLQTVELLRDVSHVRDYSMAEWVAALSRSGFAIEGITAARCGWISRSGPRARARRRSMPTAIRSLQIGAPAVRAHFAIADDGSFDIEAATFVLRAV